MKKIIMSLMAMGVSAFAGESTISQIWVKDTTTVLYFADGKSCHISAAYGHTDDYMKRMMATALTAKTTGSTVYINIAGAECKNMFLK